jgi:hypothetical protein
MRTRQRLFTTGLVAGTLMLATGLATAQSQAPTPTPSPGMSGTAQPGTNRPVPAPGTPMQGQPMQGATPRQDMTAPQDRRAAPNAAGTTGQGFVRQSANTHYLASNLEGADVYTTGGEDKIADVEDVIISDRGEVIGIVLSYGGLAGIAQSYVAVEPAALRMRRGSDGETRIETTLTAEQLRGAPAFEYSARSR